MQVTTEQLRQISILSRLDLDQVVQLQPYAALNSYLRGEIVLHEGDLLELRIVVKRLDFVSFILLAGTLNNEQVYEF